MAHARLFEAINFGLRSALALACLSVCGLAAAREEPAKKDVPPASDPADVARPTQMKADAIVHLDKAARVLEYVKGKTYGILQREIVRQAFLIAARDEFGLKVRDSALGEAAEKDLDGAQRFQIESIFSLGGCDFLEVRQGDLDARKAILKLKQLSKSDQLEGLASAGESLSRNEFSAIFEAAGLKPLKRVFRKESTLPKGAADALREMTMVSQIGALRAVHADCRAAGESPQLLGALARGYANLGVLTEHLWSADHKVFKARAMLYAERLRQKLPEEADSHRHLAYVQALIGRHEPAMKNLEIANSRPAAKLVPEWVSVIKPVCMFQEEKLAELAKKAEIASLAKLLRFSCVESTRVVKLTLRTAQDVLDANPECTRALRSMCEVGYVGNFHRATEAYLLVPAREVPKQVAALDGLPDAVSALFQGRVAEPDLWKSLAAAGAQDLTEPSWAALGRLLEDERFLSLWCRLRFMRYSWSVPTQEFAEAVEPIVANHPRKVVIQVFGFDEKRDTEKIKSLLFELPDDDVDLHYDDVWYFNSRLGARRSQELIDRAINNLDMTYRDRSFLITRINDVNHGVLWAREMSIFSPHGATGQCFFVEKDPNRLGKNVDAIEEDEGHQPLVMLGLGNRYLAKKKYDQAERWWKAYLARSPDSSVYRQLAEVARSQGQMDKWKATLDEYLKQGEHGLDFARIQTDIANYLMSQKKWDEAKPYALEAAETGAAWAMLCAHRCCEGAGDFDKAEDWIRQTSERYDNQRFGWVAWCLRTGKGNLKDASERIEEYIAALGERATPQDNTFFAFFYLQIGKDQAALGTFEKAAKVKLTEDLAMLIAITRDTLGQTKERDKLLDSFAGASVSAKLASLFRDSLAKGAKESIDLDAAQKILAGAGNSASIIAYSAGRFLENRDRAKEAASFYSRLNDNPSSVGLLARVRLRGLNLPKEP